MKEHEKIILIKMKTYALQAIEFKGDCDFTEFSNDFKTISACVFNLSQIGELVSRLDEEFINLYTQIPWRKMKGMRNKIVHDYEGIQYNIVWDVLVEFLPKLIEDIDEIIGKVEKW
ncbi:MAG: DUF86 domain-containing protein [Oscillospiraceae bacterium]|nr:DUF86 domain-containing protein [Oscillospiraceae bacterium]